MKNVSFVKRWVNGLANCEVDQTTAYLHTEDGFCCLGFACHLEDPNNWKYKGSRLYSYEDYTYGLPTDIRLKLGLTSIQEHFLQSMNDGGKTFPEIAQYLKDNVYTDINFEEKNDA